MNRKSKILMASTFIVVIGLGCVLLYYFDPFGIFEKPDHESDDPNDPGDKDPPIVVNNKTITKFGYLLQYSSYSSRTEAFNAIANYPADLMIMEPEYQCSPSVRWTTNEVSQLKSGTHPKILLAYVSIGEAENYREYWNNTWDANGDGIPDAGAPEWLDKENPDWGGNYKVKYWYSSWQQIIFGSPNASIDKIMEQGFDGIYMDIIDAFEYYRDQGVDNATGKMVDFVRAISAYTKSKNPDFLIVPQNGEELSDFPEYLEAVDGIGREDVFFDGNTKQSDTSRQWVLDHLIPFNSSGKFVLIVEYPTIPAYKQEAKELCDSNDFLLYIGPRDLDYLAEQ